MLWIPSTRIARSEMDSITGLEVRLPRERVGGIRRRLLEEREDDAVHRLLADDPRARRREGAGAAHVVAVDVRQDQRAHRLVPGGLARSGPGSAFPLFASPPESTATTPSPSRNQPTLAPLDGRRRPDAVGDLLGRRLLLLRPSRRDQRGGGRHEESQDPRVRIATIFCIALILILISDCIVPGPPPQRRRRPGIPERVSRGEPPHPAPRASRRILLRAARRDELREEAAPRAASPARFSGCHWTATSQPSPEADSTASGTPSSAVAETARPGATRAIAWWWRLLTASSGVPAIDARRVPGAIETLWSSLVFCRSVRVLVHDRGGPLDREVLDERAAQGHVDDLQAAADPEHGPLRRSASCEQRKVDRVALGVDLDVGVRQDGGPVARGIHVHAAAQHERVEVAVRLSAESGVTISIAERGTPAATSDRT